MPIGAERDPPATRLDSQAVLRHYEMDGAETRKGTSGMRFVRRLKDDSPRRQVGAELRRLIVAKGWRVGDRLPTYRQLCVTLGASLLTVQRAMNDLAAEGMVYRLRSRGTYVAKRISSRHPRLSRVGVVTHASRLTLLEPGYLNEIMTGVLAVCEQDGLDLNILSVVADGSKIQPREVAAGADGIILLGIVNDDYIATLARESIPLVVTDYQTDKVPLDYVVCDNAAATRQVMDHLFQLGHRRILYLDGAAADPLLNGSSSPLVDDSDVVERREAYLQSMADHGQGEVPRVCRFLEADARKALQRALQTAPRSEHPTAVMSYGYDIADYFLAEVSKIGLRVPHDLSLAVVGTANTQAESQLGRLTLTRCRFAFREMGEYAVRQLQRRAKGRLPVRTNVRRIQATFCAGETTRLLHR